MMRAPVRRRNPGSAPPPIRHPAPAFGNGTTRSRSAGVSPVRPWCASALPTGRLKPAVAFGDLHAVGFAETNGRQQRTDFLELLQFDEEDSFVRAHPQPPAAVFLRSEARR